jgi:hypothetical protein
MGALDRGDAGRIRPEAEQVGVYVNLMDGKGTAWLDDVELVPE